LFVSGTHSLGDVATDLLIPLGGIRISKRYKTALSAVDKGGIKTVVGHSLGAFIGQEIINERNYLSGRLYGSPSIVGSSSRNVKYFRHRLDPVSMLNTMPLSSNSLYPQPHSYSGFG